MAVMERPSVRADLAEEVSEKPLVIVGGAAGEVGQATCGTLRSNGFHIVGADRKYPSPFGVEYVDLSDPRDVSRFFTALREEHQTIHSYVSLVWGGLAEKGFSDVTYPEMAETLRHTFYSALWPAQEAVRWMKEAGGGYVVIVSSINSVLGLNEFAYDAAKGALNRIAPDIATSCGKYGVYATTLLPGTIGGTPSWVGKEAELERIAAEIPDGRVTTAQEVADWITFLLSGGVEAVNGQEIRLDRGWSVSKPGFKKS